MLLKKETQKTVINEKEIEYDVYTLESEKNPDYSIRIVLSKDKDAKKYQKLVLEQCLKEQNTK